MLQVTEDDATKWKESFVYGAGMERISMTYLPAYDHDNGWEPSPGVGGADPDVTPKTLYYMTDILGSTIGLLTQDGRLSARYHYDEFGMVLDSKKFDVNWPGPDNLYGYTGLEYDYYTDLNYARARYYKPEIGRFISEDTYKGDMWNSQSQNLYTYVQNNPLMYIDLTGNAPVKSRAGTMEDIVDIIENIENESPNKSPAEILILVKRAYDEKVLTRFVYTEEMGWIDLRHFFTLAELANRWYISDGMARGMGIGNEILQDYKGSESAWSYEDLTSNKAGALFGQDVYDNGKSYWQDVKSFFGFKVKLKKLSEMFEDYFVELLPLKPEEAPYWDSIPETDKNYGSN